MGGRGRSIIKSTHPPLPYSPPCPGGTRCDMVISPSCISLHSLTQPTPVETLVHVSGHMLQYRSTHCPMLTSHVTYIPCTTLAHVYARTQSGTHIYMYIELMSPWVF